MTIFLQREPGEAMSVECKLVYRHCVMEGIKTTYIALSDLKDSCDKIAGADLMVGSVEFIRETFAILGLSEPPINYYPKSLSHLLYRNIRKGVFADVWASVLSDKEVFAKSIGCKLLTGQVFGPTSMPQNEVPSDLPVLLCDPVNFLSEYRIYVNRNKIVANTLYWGKDTNTIDIGVVEGAVSILASCPNTPKAYAIDFGLLSSGETALVEMNDAWAIGAYDGISAADYFRLLMTRWDEMTNKKAVA